MPSLKTDDLIRALAEDGTARSPSLAGRMAVALVIGGSVATVLFALVLGVRPDIASALQTWRFVLKVAFALICCMFALWACTRLTRPEIGLRDTLVGLVVAPALLAAAVGVRAADGCRPDDWYARASAAMRASAWWPYPLLSLAPLADVLAALRVGAPRSPLHGRRRGRIVVRARSRQRSTPCIARTTRRCSSPSGIRWRSASSCSPAPSPAAACCDGDGRQNGLM